MVSRVFVVVLAVLGVASASRGGGSLHGGRGRKHGGNPAHTLHVVGRPAYVPPAIVYGPPNHAVVPVAPARPEILSPPKPKPKPKPAPKPAPAPKKGRKPQWKLPIPQYGSPHRPGNGKHSQPEHGPRPGDKEDDEKTRSGKHGDNAKSRSGKYGDNADNDDKTRSETHSGVPVSEPTPCSSTSNPPHGPGYGPTTTASSSHVAESKSKGPATLRAPASGTAAPYPFVTGYRNSSAPCNSTTFAPSPSKSPSLSKSRKPTLVLTSTPSASASLYVPPTPATSPTAATTPTPAPAPAPAAPRPTGGMPDLSNVKPCYGPQCDDTAAPMNYEQVISSQPDVFQAEAAAGRVAACGWAGLAIGVAAGLWVI